MERISVFGEYAIQIRFTLLYFYAVHIICKNIALWT